MDVTRSAPAAAVFLLVGLGLTFPAEPGQDPDLDELLRRAAAYIEEYERRIPAVVSQEHYAQYVEFGQYIQDRRRLVSDVAVISMPDVGWAFLRDVAEVDGRPVRDREERLSRLFLESRPDTIEQARRIVQEGARFNLNYGKIVVSRTINNPMMALRFLRTENQHRSRFSLEEMANVDGVRAAVVEFTEDAWPRLIASSDDAAASGRLWIEPESGRFVRSELKLQTRGGPGSPLVVCAVRVRFSQVEDSKLWVPVEMNEEYRLQGSTRLTGRATYSNFRTFRVEVETIIKESEALGSG